MATRSSIGIQTQDGKYKAIYCHWDGYIEGVGETLKEFYNTPEKVEQLLALGDISILADNLDDTVAYHRDRGEELQMGRIFDTYREMVDNVFCDYIYVFNDGEWYVYDDFFDVFRTF